MLESSPQVLGKNVFHEIDHSAKKVADPCHRVPQTQVLSDLNVS